MVKLEGTGEGMLAELAEDMLQRNGWLLCFAFAFSFYAFLPLLHTSHDSS